MERDKVDDDIPNINERTKVGGKQMKIGEQASQKSGFGGSKKRGAEKPGINLGLGIHD